MKLRLLSTLLILFACATVPQAQDEPEAEAQPQGLKLANPSGPDELFTPIPAEGLHIGAVPAKQFKTVLLRVPNTGSWKETPDEDLKSSYRPLSGAVRLRAEQLLEAAPHIYGEENMQRVEYYKARLRALESPNVGIEAELGKAYAGPVNAARTFNAEYVVMLSFARTEDGANAGIYIHQRGEGLVAAKVFALLKPDKESPTKAITNIQNHVDEVLRKITQLPTSPEDATPANPVPIPSLVSVDKALKPFVKMRKYLETGELSRAYVEFVTLNTIDPDNGRVALYGIEVLRVLADNQEIEAERQKFLQLSLKVGRDALANNPNDVMLRGKLAWNSFTFYWRRKWAVGQLDIALKVQPANFNLLTWRSSIEFWEDKAAQLEWTKKHALNNIKDGRAELQLGNIEFNQGKHAEGVAWYKKAIAINPGEHEFHVSLGLCSTYYAERLARQVMPGARGNEVRKQRDAAFSQAATAMETALDLDPTVVKWVYEYYVRSATHDFKIIPADETRRYRVFLAQAVMNGLENSSRSWEWKRLVKDVNDIWKKRLRKDVKEAKIDDPLFCMKMQARLVLSAIDGDTKDRVVALWKMRGQGFRTSAYYSWMNSLEPLVEEYTE